VVWWAAFTAGRIAQRPVAGLLTESSIRRQVQPGSCRIGLAKLRDRSHSVISTQGRSLVVKTSKTESEDQSDDFLLLELLSDFDDLSLDLAAESDLLDDSLAFLSAAAPLL